MSTADKILRALGTDDSVNVCDCCGRTNLKATVAFETKSGDVVHFGFVCASRAIGKPVPAIRYEAKAADEAKEAARRREAHEADKARTARWEAHLVALTGGIFQYDGRPDVFRMLQAAGGFSKAVETFSA